MNPDPLPGREPWFRPLPLALGLAVGTFAALLPLGGEAYRPWNVAPFGTIGLFVAARGGFWPALLLSLGAKLGYDLLNYREHGFDALYRPDAVIYGCLAVYAVLGWGLLRKTNSPLKIVGAAVLGGLPFFLVTNAVSWQDKTLQYADGIDGLFQSYYLALPFHRGTLVSDVLFTGLLFGLYAVLSRAAAPRPAVAPVPVEERA